MCSEILKRDFQNLRKASVKNCNANIVLLFLLDNGYIVYSNIEVFIFLKEIIQKANF